MTAPWWTYRNYIALLKDCLNAGTRVMSRLGPTAELLNVTYEFTPGDVVYRRGISEPLMWCELLQLIGGVFDPETLRRAAPKAAHDFFTQQMAYGPRVQRHCAAVTEILRQDPTSRRALLILPERGETEPTCTLAIHFLVREQRLLTFVSMRSWDLWLGLPYDVVMFGGLAQAMAASLDMSVGPVRVTANSAHLYRQHWDPDFEAIDNILNHFHLRTPAETRYAGGYWAALASLAVTSLLDCPWKSGSPTLIEKRYALGPRPS